LVDFQVFDISVTEELQEMFRAHGKAGVIGKRYESFRHFRKEYESLQPRLDPDSGHLFLPMKGFYSLKDEQFGWIQFQLGATWTLVPQSEEMRASLASSNLRHVAGSRRDLLSQATQKALEGLPSPTSFREIKENSQPLLELMQARGLEALSTVATSQRDFSIDDISLDELKLSSELELSSAEQLMLAEQYAQAQAQGTPAGYPPPGYPPSGYPPSGYPPAG
jgi:hypothetical protein